MEIFYTMLGALLFALAFAVFCLIASKKTRLFEHKNVEWCSETYTDYSEVDDNGVTSSIFLGTGRYYTKDAYEEYRKNVFEKIDRAIKKHE